MSNDAAINVVGGGIAGLVAAITAAEGGASVVLHEAGAQLGGRARSGDGPYGVNLGPHVVYRGGALTRFLRDRHLDRELVLGLPRVRGVRFVDERGPHRPIAALGAFVAMHAKREAPVDVEFDTWATRSFGRRIGTQLRHLSGLYTFHHDPGSLAADFVWRRCRRTLARPDTVRYIGGGWASLVSTLERAASARGVRIELDSPVDVLPDAGPVVVALPARPAGVLLDTTLDWPTARTALLDIALDRPGALAAMVLDTSSDLRGCLMVERFTAGDRSLAPAGIELVQAQLGVDAETALDDAVARMERTLDELGAWRGHEVWRRALVVEGASGAVDPVGTTWRDRPAIDQGAGRYLAGDAVAAPGMLSEVSVNSGVRAAHLALAERRRRLWAPGWPTTELTAAMRARVLAAALPNARVRTRYLSASLERAWTAEPVIEVEPYRVRSQRLGATRITSAEPASGGGTSITTVVVRTGGRRRSS
jgi:hypothetical protein